MPSDPDLYMQDGLNWDYIREKYDRECSEEEREAQNSSLKSPIGNHKIPKEPAILNRSPVQNSGQFQVSIPPERRQLAIDYYKAGNRIPWIAKELKMADATVRNILKAVDAYEPGRDRSRKK